MSGGTANVVGEHKESIELVADGDCLTATLDNLRRGGYGGARPMSVSALTKVRADALELLGEVLESYVSSVGAGEVGAGGSGRAATAPPRGERGPTGLLYGRVQSGKTVAMITFSAAALDNGFRVVIVLTSDNVKLVEQTAGRFGALHGALVKHSTAIESWEPDAEHMAREVGDSGLVIICAKNGLHLERLVSFLETIGAGQYPALILDDEADQATLDTTVAARSSKKASAPKHASKIHRITVQNTSEEGASIRERLPHHVFLQVTATPYALLLQRSENPLRPSFTHLLEPGVGYTGGESFFSAEHVEGQRPPLVYVDEDESARIEGGTSEAPIGLQKAICFFLVSAAAQYQKSEGPVEGQNFLCHTSHKQVEHDRLGELIREFLGKLRDCVRVADLPGECGVRLHWGYEELLKTIPEAPPLDSLRIIITRRLPRREIPIVNAATGGNSFGPELNFIIGGNILGRGLTIDNLLVTYYLRRAKISQMDTVLQHARMFGYRSGLMAYTRVFLPESLAYRFHFIHEAERRLRTRLSTRDERAKLIVETTLGLRPTRANVLDTGSLCAYEPGEQIYPIAPATDRAAVGKARKVEDAVKKAMGGSMQQRQYVEVSIDTLIELLMAVPYEEEDAGSWQPETLAKILKTVATSGYLFYRDMERKKARLTTGAVSGPEQEEARSKGKPVLFVLRDSGKHFGGEPFWYPTIVMPAGMATQVFNVT